MSVEEHIKAAKSALAAASNGSGSGEWGPTLSDRAKYASIAQAHLAMAEFMLREERRAF